MKRRFSNDTYGWDSFSVFLVLVSLPFMFSVYTFTIGVVLAGYGALRVLSSNFEKREKERLAFENHIRQLVYKFYIIKQKAGLYNFRLRIDRTIKQLRDRKYYVIFKCPSCGQKLRVPRNKGTLMVICKRCSHKFKKRT